MISKKYFCYKTEIVCPIEVHTGYPTNFSQPMSQGHLEHKKNRYPLVVLYYVYVLWKSLIAIRCDVP